MARNADRYTPNWAKPCQDAIQHGPADGTGKCPWCGMKIATTMGRPPRVPVTELTEAYGEHYDPDYGALTRAEINARWAMGQNP